LILWVALLGLVVFVELARRRVPVAFAARDLGDRLRPPQSTHLPLKLTCGSDAHDRRSLAVVFAVDVRRPCLRQTSPWLVAAYQQIAPGHLGHMILSLVAIITLAFIYTAFVVDPSMPQIP